MDVIDKKYNKHGGQSRSKSMKLISERLHFLLIIYLGQCNGNPNVPHNIPYEIKIKRETIAIEDGFD